MRRLTAALVCGLASVAAACGGKSPEPEPAMGRFPLRQQLAVDRDLRRQEPHHRGPQHGGGVGRPDPPTRILSPAAGQTGQPYPLLVFAHGSGGSGTGYDLLLRKWATAAYVVAAPASRFDGTTPNWVNGPSTCPSCPVT